MLCCSLRRLLLRAVGADTLIQSYYGSRFMVFAATASRDLLVFQAVPAVAGCGAGVANSPLVVAHATTVALAGDICEWSRSVRVRWRVVS